MPSTFGCFGGIDADREALLVSRRQLREVEQIARTGATVPASGMASIAARSERGHAGAAALLDA